MSLVICEFVCKLSVCLGNPSVSDQQICLPFLEYQRVCISIYRLFYDTLLSVSVWASNFNYVVYHSSSISQDEGADEGTPTRYELILVNDLLASHHSEFSAFE